VAKEYVAAQDPADPGVLILSQFAGAAEQMTDALIVNPYNIEETADLILGALEMGVAERCRRHESMLAASGPRTSRASSPPREAGAQVDSVKRSSRYR
jgi:trehalose-6-phosphate synthase